MSAGGQVPIEEHRPIRRAISEIEVAIEFVIGQNAGTGSEGRLRQPPRQDTAGSLIETEQANRRSAWLGPDEEACGRFFQDAGITLQGACLQSLSVMNCESGVLAVAQRLRACVAGVGNSFGSIGISTTAGLPAASAAFIVSAT